MPASHGYKEKTSWEVHGQSVAGRSSASAAFADWVGRPDHPLVAGPRSQQSRTGHCPVGSGSGGSSGSIDLSHFAVLVEVEELLGGGNRPLVAMYRWETSERGRRGRATAASGAAHRGGRAAAPRCRRGTWVGGATAAPTATDTESDRAAGGADDGRKF